MSVYVRPTRLPLGWRAAGTSVRCCASLYSRSLFLPKITAPSSVAEWSAARVSHISGPEVLESNEAGKCHDFRTHLVGVLLVSHEIAVSGIRNHTMDAPRGQRYQ